MAMITANNIEMRFGNRLLYRFDHLRLSQHKVIHLQGDNGSGKTTLMKLFAGLLRPSAGDVRAEGFLPSPWWRRNPLLGKAVYLHQHPYLFDGTVVYNLNYVQPFCGLDHKEIQARTNVAIEMAQLEHLLSQRASSLSGGERQRLAIARAWIMRPQLLMLDEPTSNMDTLSQQLVLEMINQLKRDGTGMLISSHQSCSLTGLCEQAWQIQTQSIEVMPSTVGDLPLTPSQQELRYVTAN